MSEPNPMPRIAFEVPRELNNRLDGLVPWGLKAQLMRVILEMVLTALEQHGPAALGLILAGKMRLSMREVEVEVESAAS